MKFRKIISLKRSLLALAVLLLGAGALWFYTLPKKYESPLLVPEGDTLRERFLPPEGYARTEAAAGSLAEFLRDYPMEPDGTRVHLYNGKELLRSSAAAVFSMHLGNRDLQQCADSVMRVYAEYLRKNGREDAIAFHFVSGFLCDWKTYRSGMRVKVDGNTVNWYAGDEPSASDATFEKYLEIVFSYASTLSLQNESAPADLEDVRVGDMFLRPGSPGHVVLVVDVCEKDGKKAFLLAQGNMPAQQFHVLKNSAHPKDPWYYVDEVKYPLSTGTYTFEEGSFRRPVYLEDEKENE